MPTPLDVLAASIAVQDQEWAAGCSWMADPVNLLAVLEITAACIAPDPADLTALATKDPRFAVIIQHLACLALVECLNRNIEAKESDDSDSNGG